MFYSRKISEYIFIHIYIPPIFILISAATFNYYKRWKHCAIKVSFLSVK
jgi:hypothetical protein